MTGVVIEAVEEPVRRFALASAEEPDDVELGRRGFFGGLVKRD